MKFSSHMFDWFKKKKILVTHNGSFHADDVFAAATLTLWLDAQGLRYKIIRTRNEDIIAAADYVFDVGHLYDHGACRYDHHQAENPGTHLSGIPYAAFGLIWRHYGLDICMGDTQTFQDLNESIVQPLDASDNGIDLYQTNQYGISPVVLQNVLHWISNTEDKDSQFVQAYNFARTLLQNVINERLIKNQSVAEIRELYSTQEKGPIAVFDIPTSRHTVTEALASNLEAVELLYAVYPDKEMTKWNILALPLHGATFELKKALPESWRGLQAEELQQASGVATAQFCHKSGFWMFATTKEDALELAKKSVSA